MFRQYKRLNQGIGPLFDGGNDCPAITNSGRIRHIRRNVPNRQRGTVICHGYWLIIKDHFPSGGSSNISIPSLKDGKFGPGTESINANELNPMTSSTGGGAAQYFPDGLEPNLEELEGIYDDEGGMGQLGNSSKETLFVDANSDNPSYTGSAYKMLLDKKNSSRPDFTNDPMLMLQKRFMTT